MLFDLSQVRSTHDPPNTVHGPNFLPYTCSLLNSNLLTIFASAGQRILALSLVVYYKSTSPESPSPETRESSKPFIYLSDAPDRGDSPPPPHITTTIRNPKKKETDKTKTQPTFSNLPKTKTNLYLYGDKYTSTAIH